SAMPAWSFPSWPTPLRSDAAKSLPVEGRMIVSGERPSTLAAGTSGTAMSKRPIKSFSLTSCANVVRAVGMSRRAATSLAYRETSMCALSGYGEPKSDEHDAEIGELLTMLDLAVGDVVAVLREIHGDIDILGRVIARAGV